MAPALGLAPPVHAGPFRRRSTAWRSPHRPIRFRRKTRWPTISRPTRQRFALPVRNGVKVDRLSRQGERYLVSAGDQQFEAEHVVVAMANYQNPRVPSFARDLDPGIVQLHSRDYRSPAQLRDGDVLLVGAGNSGAEIALEVARAGHRTWMSGRDTGSVPFRLGGLLGRLFLTRFVLRFVFHRVLTLNTPLGRKVRPKIIHQGGPLIRVKSRDLPPPMSSGCRRWSACGKAGPCWRMAACSMSPTSSGAPASTRRPRGSTCRCSPHDGEPIHERGQVTNEPGLYFVGRHFLYAMSSTMIHGVGRDAEHIVEVIAARTAASRRIAVVTSTRSAIDAGRRRSGGWQIGDRQTWTAACRLRAASQASDAWRCPAPAAWSRDQCCGFVTQSPAAPADRVRSGSALLDLPGSGNESKSTHSRHNLTKTSETLQAQPRLRWVASSRALHLSERFQA